MSIDYGLMHQKTALITLISRHRDAKRRSEIQRQIASI